MKCVTSRTAAAALGVLLIAALGQAQPQPPTPGTPPAANRLSPAQLDALTAPIALYPDPLLGSILAAATYPLEVVEAARWLDDPAHAALKGAALEEALQGEPWDVSVKSLVSSPDVLQMMNRNLEWTEQIGDAFLAQQDDVMDSVQRLRQRAAANGSLRSTPQQTVATDQGDITIEPASPEVVYVPYYVPADVYAPWPWPDYPPYAFPLPPGVVYGGAFIGFGIPIFEPFWGWCGWNWPGHGFVVYPHRPHQPGLPTRQSEAGHPWQHDPVHRGGVPYRDSATAARFFGSDAAARREFRGFPPELARSEEAAEAARAPHARAPAAVAPPTSRPAPMPPPMPAPAAPHRVSPAFESFGRGPQVRGEAARGFSSRSMAAPPFHGGGASPGHR